MMKRLCILCAMYVCVVYSIEHSLRIQALGTDFAYLIPDYETDLYNNPQLLGKQLTGISYEPNLDEPVTARILFKRFGLCGRYWGSSWSETLSYYGSTRNSKIAIKDLWMLDLRGKLWKFLASDVWHWYNDGYYYELLEENRPQTYESEKTIKYLFRVNAVHKLGKHVDLINKVGGGIYHYARYYQYYQDEWSCDQWLVMYSMRSGVYFHNFVDRCRFSSAFVEIGGPVSIHEIDSLPYSILSDVTEFGEVISPFAKTFTGTFGLAKALPVSDSSFLAIGLREYFLFQRTNEVEFDIQLCGVRNILSLPIALEYTTAAVTLRIGTRLYYRVDSEREWLVNGTLLHSVEHQFDIGYSFGLSWQLDEHWIVDLCSSYDVSRLDHWSIYLKHI